MKLSKGAITAEALPQLRDELLKAKKIDDIQLPGLSSDRRPIIAGGILVLKPRSRRWACKAAGEQGRDARRHPV